MSAIFLTRLSDPLRQPESVREAVKQFLTGIFGGADKASHATWLRLWNRVSKLEDGEIIELAFKQPRSGAYHRRHFAMIAGVFDNQEQFASLEQFLNWVKIGCGHCDWRGGIGDCTVPVPKSISYAAQDQEEFEKFHEAAVAWLQTERPQSYLWPHLTPKSGAEMMDLALSTSVI